MLPCPCLVTSMNYDAEFGTMDRGTQESEQDTQVS